MQKSHSLLVSTLLATIMTSCATVSYNVINFDVLRPAVYTLPTWVDTIVIANAAQTSTFNDKSIDANSTIAKDIATACQKSLPMQICRNIKNDIANTGYVTTLLYDGLIAQGPKGNATIDSMLRNHPSTIILALSELESTTELSINEAQDDTEVNCGTMTCATKTRFKLINAPGKEIPLDVRHDTLDFIGCATTLKGIVERLPSIADKYNEIGANSAQRTADLLIPGWQRVRRTVFVTNNSNMVMAEQWVLQDNWQEARNLWIETATSAKKSTDRIRAALNIALSYEREDNIDSAAQWCSKALDMIETSAPKTQKALEHEKMKGEAMFRYFIERMKQKKVLDTQM